MQAMSHWLESAGQGVGGGRNRVWGSSADCKSPCGDNILSPLGDSRSRGQTREINSQRAPPLSRVRGVGGRARNCRAGCERAGPGGESWSKVLIYRYFGGLGGVLEALGAERIVWPRVEVQENNGRRRPRIARRNALQSVALEEWAALSGDALMLQAGAAELVGGDALGPAAANSVRSATRRSSLAPSRTSRSALCRPRSAPRNSERRPHRLCASCRERWRDWRNAPAGTPGGAPSIGGEEHFATEPDHSRGMASNREDGGDDCESTARALICHRLVTLSAFRGYSEPAPFNTKL